MRITSARLSISVSMHCRQVKLYVSVVMNRMMQHASDRINANLFL